MSDSRIDLQSLQTIDSVPIDGTSPDLLDIERVRAHIEGAIKRRRYTGDPDPIAYLTQRRCLVQGGDELLATPAGILAFAREPQRFFANSGVHLLHYRGTQPSSLDVIHIERAIAGTIFDQLTRIEEYLNNNTKHGMTIQSGYERVEVHEYPPVVLRELGVNMIAHRDYRDLHSFASVKLFADHIEWMNPGGLPEGVTIDQLLNVQRSRNPALFALLFDRGLIEGVGQGLDTVVETLSREKMQPAQFEDINHAFFVARVRGRAIESIFQHDAYAQLNPRQKQTLDVIRERGEVTVNDLRGVLGVTISARQILRDLNLLGDMGLIVIVGRSRNTRYRIVSKPRLSPFEP